MRTLSIFQVVENKRKKKILLSSEQNALHTGTLIKWATKLHFFFLASCLLIFEVACKKANTPSTQTQGSSSLSFNYTGFKTGTYSAVGEIPIPPPGTVVFDYQWATAQSFSDYGNKWIGVNANMPITNNILASNTFQIFIPNTEIGVCPLPGNYTSDDALVFNLVRGSGVLQEYYHFTSGNFQATSATINRFSGTFTATATDINTPGRTIQITNGLFDLKVTQ